jgi:hypothetical protein
VPECDVLQLLVEQTQKLMEESRQMREQLDRMEKAQALSVVKEGYTVAEVAERVDRDEWTVRQWCNKGKVRARKVSGRGQDGEWRIPHEEVRRIEAEGPCREGTFKNHGPVPAGRQR